ncbi:MAG: hypothetical protein ACO3LG_07265, partial [Ilumatobacteraceae bacterium]
GFVAQREAQEMSCRKSRQVLEKINNLRANLLKIYDVDRELTDDENDRADVARAIEVTLSLETVHYLDRRHPRSTLRTTLEFMARSILGQH